MAVVYNVKAPRVSDAGEIQRKKYDGGLPVSLGFGLFLGADEADRSGNAKVYFLMSTLAPGTGDVLHPSLIRAYPRLRDIPLELMDFSKKFVAGDLVLELLQPGSEYWFAYTAEATSSVIQGKQVIYEKLDLLLVSDQPGFPGVRAVLEALQFVKPATA